MRGAAWGVPAIALATSTPAFAASGDLTLSLSTAALVGPACLTLPGVSLVLSRETRGRLTPAPGTHQVTCTLTGGFVFSDGTTTAVISVVDGVGTVPGITAPALAASGRMDAALAGSTARAWLPLTAIAPPSTAYTVAGPGAGPQVQPSVFPGSVPVGGSTFLTTFAQLVDVLHPGTPPLPPAASAHASGSHLTLVDVAGSTYFVDRNLPMFTPTGFMPGPGAVAVGTGLFLHGTTVSAALSMPGGAPSPVVQVTASASAVVQRVRSGSYRHVTVRTTSATAGGVQHSTFAGALSQPPVQTGAFTVPADARAVGVHVFLTPDGRLHLGETVVATGVTSAWATAAQSVHQPTVQLSWVKDGTSRTAEVAWGTTSLDGLPATTHAATRIPADAVHVSPTVLLTPGGQLHRVTDASSLLASGVTQAAADGDVVGFVAQSC